MSRNRRGLIAKLSSYRNIYKTDYQQQFQSTVDSLAQIINPAFTELYNALNNNLTFADNISATIVTFKTSVDGTGTPITPITFNLIKGQSSAQGLITMNIVCSNNASIYPAGGLFYSFTASGSSVTISNIQGLSKDNQWNITLLVI